MCPDEEVRCARGKGRRFPLGYDWIYRVGVCVSLSLPVVCPAGAGRLTKESAVAFCSSTAAGKDRPATPACGVVAVSTAERRCGDAGRHAPSRTRAELTDSLQPGPRLPAASAWRGPITTELGQSPNPPRASADCRVVLHCSA